MSDKPLSATEKWALKNKKSKAKPSDLGSGAASKAADALKNRKSRIDAAVDGYTINGKKPR